MGLKNKWIKMRLLIGGSPSKMFHLKEFENALIKLGIECKLVKGLNYNVWLLSKIFIINSKYYILK